jgi:ATP-dependent 26S proteasome regulatory subunit
MELSKELTRKETNWKAVSVTLAGVSTGDWRIESTKGMLLYGPPGTCTGKSSLVQAVATVAKYCLMAATVADFEENTAVVRDVFEKARKSE